MKKIPKLHKRSPLFQQKILITIPPWGVFVFTAAVCVAIIYAAQIVAIAICVILTAVAAIAVWSAYKQLNEMRHQVHNILHDIENLEFHEENPPAPEVIPDAIPRISVKR